MTDLDTLTQQLLIIKTHRRPDATDTAPDDDLSPDDATPNADN